MLQLLQEAKKKQNICLHYDKTRREKDNDDITYKHQYVTIQSTSKYVFRLSPVQHSYFIRLDIIKSKRIHVKKCFEFHVLSDFVLNHVVRIKH